MSPIRGSSQALRAGFLLLDPATGTLSKIIEFPLNPAMLTRELQAAPLGSTPAEPREVLSFNLVLDASDGLANRDPLVMALGVSPLLSALELLLYGPGPADRQPVVVFVWGGNRVLPVRVLSMQITEQLFDAKLNPIRAQIAFTLQSLKSADLPADSLARRLWDTHLQVLEELSFQILLGKLSDLGLTGI